MAFRTRKDAGTAGEKLKDNIRSLREHGHRMKWILSKLDPKTAEAFYAYFNEEKFKAYELGNFAAVGPTTYWLGELSSALNIALRLAGYQTWSAFEMAYEKQTA